MNKLLKKVLTSKKARNAAAMIALVITVAPTAPWQQ